jgi:hypothetical protein
MEYKQRVEGILEARREKSCYVPSILFLSYERTKKEILRSFWEHLELDSVGKHETSESQLRR